MSHVELDGSRIETLIGKVEPTRVPQHVWVHWKPQPGLLPRATYNVPHSRRRQRASTLSHEDIRGLLMIDTPSRRCQRLMTLNNATSITPFTPAPTKQGKGLHVGQN